MMRQNTYSGVVSCVISRLAISFTNESPSQGAQENALHDLLNFITYWQTPYSHSFNQTRNHKHPFQADQRNSLILLQIAVQILLRGSINAKPLADHFKRPVAKVAAAREIPLDEDEKAYGNLNQ